MSSFESGDLVGLLEATMGARFSTGISGIIIKPVSEKSSMWIVLIQGQPREIHQELLVKMEL